MVRDFPASDFQSFVGKTITSIEDREHCDEGIVITFDDRSKLKIGFSGCEGDIIAEEVQQCSR